MRVLFIILSLGLVFASCTKNESTVDFPTHDSKLVVNGKFGTDSNWRFQLSKSVSMIDTTQDLMISSATIKIYEEDSLIETLTDDDLNIYRRGIYQSADKYPEAGKNYRVEVSKKGFETAIGSSYLDDPIAIKSLDIDMANVRLEGDKKEDWFWYTGDITLKVTIDDPVGNNYYEILAYKVDTFYEREGFEDNIDSSAPMLTTQMVYLQTIDPSAKMKYGSSVLFEDALFDGTQKEFVLTGYYYGESETDNIFVQVRSISHEYYLYETTFHDFVENDGVPLAEPVQVFNNITNGFGVFAGYSSYYDTLFVDFRD